MIASQIIDALEFCHKKEITHRDIKLENILIDQKMNAKIIDFGFSTCFPNNQKVCLFLFIVIKGEIILWNAIIHGP